MKRELDKVIAEKRKADDPFQKCEISKSFWFKNHRTARKNIQTLIYSYLSKSDTINHSEFL